MMSTAEVVVYDLLKGIFLRDEPQRNDEVAVLDSSGKE